MRWKTSTFWMGLVLVIIVVAGCGQRREPVARPVPPPPTVTPPAATPAPAPPPPTAERVDDGLPVPPPPFAEDDLAARTLDDLNRDSPFEPVFFDVDSAELSESATRVLAGNAELLKQYPTWTITIEGHCDERGTAEYNLALGERRAVAVRNYLVSVGIGADRLRIVSYGEEFPFARGTDEAAHAQNRRAHFVITAK